MRMVSKTKIVSTDLLMKKSSRILSMINYVWLGHTEDSSMRGGTLIKQLTAQDQNYHTKTDSTTSF